MVMTPTSRVVVVHDGDGDQVVALKGAGDVALLVLDMKGAKAVLGDVAQGHVALGGQDAAQCDVAHGLEPWGRSGPRGRIGGQFGP
jgi:hypothetical protein